MIKRVILLAFAVGSVRAQESVQSPILPSAVSASAGADAVVARDGSGAYRTVQEAIDAAPKTARSTRPWTIFVKAGVYRELIYIQREKRYLRLIGEGAEKTVLTYDLSEGLPGQNGQPIGMYRTPTVQIDADDFTAADLTLENSAGPAGRAVSVRVDGDRVVFQRCRLLGWEDAVLLNRGRQYFDRCTLAGGYDFILGGATAFFDHCRIICRGNCLITAASTQAEQPFGYVFADCTIEAETAVAKAYLGRLWGPYADVIYLRTRMSATVLPDGWHEFANPDGLPHSGQPDRKETARFAEYGSTGPGANPGGRVPWSRQLTEAEARAITVQCVLGGADGWDPTPPSAPKETPAAFARSRLPLWLEHAVFYQIYPQSFADSNGDGIGDLRGIIQKLPYLHDLGVTGIWLNPCFVSPFGDAGYDVADFYRVAPRYGTNADLRELFAEARQRGIRVMLDLVAGHTSDQHPWFRESQRAEPNRYSDWYIWTNGVWVRSVPGQQVVVGGAERDGNFIANFFHFQPALNYGYAKPDPAQPWQQPVDAPGPRAVRAELKKIVAYWFDLGASGFRVDMAFSLIKGDPDGRATAALWREFRTWMDQAYPDCALVSEWSKPQISIPAGFHMDFLLHKLPGYTALFRSSGGTAPIFDRSGSTSFRVFLDEFEPLYRATMGLGYIAIPSGNHDTVPRLGNRRDAGDLAVADAFLLTMPGVPFIYYGDEIGMRSLPGLRSKEGGYNRTGARTPMQWDASANAGFSTAPAADLYIPIDPAPTRPTVEAELADPDSVLWVVKNLIALRRSHPSLGASGAYETLVAGPGLPCVYSRSKDGERILVALNPTGKPLKARLPPGLSLAAVRTLAGVSRAFRRGDGGWFVTLPAVSYAIDLELK